MRVGQNPAKFIDHVAQPQRITVAVANYIPFIGGYYATSFEVLQACLNSIWENADLPFDLMVFDNASCAPVRQFLSQAYDQGKIQYLVLSDRNVGKGGAWNFIFGAAPGEYLAYCDNDVFFYPGWLSNMMKVFEEVPEAGMVTGAPLRIPQEFAVSTLAWAEKTDGAKLERGVLLPWEDYWSHAHSLGIQTKEEGRKLYAANEDVVLHYNGSQYYVGASHFQFIAPTSVLRQTLPIPSDRPMGQVRTLDIAVDKLGYLRLSTDQWWVRHLGNTMPADLLERAPVKQITLSKKTASASNLARIKPVRRALVWLYNKIFALLYRNGS